MPRVSERSIRRFDSRLMASGRSAAIWWRVPPTNVTDNPAAISIGPIVTGVIRFADRTETPLAAHDFECVAADDLPAGRATARQRKRVMLRREKPNGHGHRHRGRAIRR